MADRARGIKSPWGVQYTVYGDAKTFTETIVREESARQKKKTDKTQRRSKVRNSMYDGLWQPASPGIILSTLGPAIYFDLQSLSMGGRYVPSPHTAGLYSTTRLVLSRVVHGHDCTRSATLKRR